MTTLAAMNLDEIERDVRARIEAADDLRALDDVRVEALGKKGSVSLLMRELGKMSPEDRKDAGPRLNALRDALDEAVSAKKAALEDAALEARLASERIDVTLQAPDVSFGSIHPVSQVMEECIAVLADQGFVCAEGPDIEDDFHNFTALNFPEGHPARDMHDTFFVEAVDEHGMPKCLRTHTSPVQIRAMVEQGAPIRIIAPGRTYRCDSDQTHTPMFHQIEGLAIDRDIHMGHLKGCLERFIADFFETDVVETRFRPHHFPFTEPSAEMDVRYERVGDEVRIGQGDKWMEILGCGMVHPNVLRAAGLDPEEWQGFAFGMGVDRLAMLKYGIPDLRDFFAADPRWLRHYGFSPLRRPSKAFGL